MPISPMVLGSTRRVWQLPFLTESGVVGLTGATLTMRIQLPDKTVANGVNTPTIAGDPTLGIINWQRTATDFPVIGLYQLMIIADFGGGSIEESDWFPLQVNPKI